jgi:oxygen-independent coproporphyrinogen III oxidase
VSTREGDPVADYLEPSDGPSESDGRADAAIYVHFPFCRHMCTYCDFDTFTGLEALVGSYVDAAARQIEISPKARATSLYIGGGTPSIMSPDQAHSLLGHCRHRFLLRPESEATIEANPTDMSLPRLLGFRQAGFNRLSVGVQSADAKLLRLLGRRHTPEDSTAAIRAARDAGFENVSVDLIYGIPRQDLTVWRETLESIVEWNVEHVSCYMLTVEPGTPMERGVSRGTLQLPPEEEVVAMYDLAAELLGTAGYRHYEISNWARPGRESAHNLTYWRNRQYLGIGAGAAGFWAGRRYKVLPRIRAYAEGTRVGRIPLSESEEISPRRAMSDTLILGLRLEEGVSVAAFGERHGVSPDEVYGEVLQWGVDSGLLARSGGRLRLTDRGIMLSNELFERLL